MKINDNEWITQVNFDDDGLIPAIAQDHLTHRVLMMAWMNQSALHQPLATERVTYWSRSRQALWRKGESSGHEQILKEVQLDCDGDVLILRIEQIEDIACHTGRNSCFFRTLTNDGWRESEPVLKDPREIYPDG